MLAFVSGASTGFGRSVCWALAGPDAAGAGTVVDFVLTARSVDGLEGTRAVIAERSPASKVHTVPFDMADMAALDGNLERLFTAGGDLAARKRVLLVNNAGSLGPLEFVRDYEGTATLQKVVDLNVTSVAATTSAFLKRIDADAQQAAIVNVSSLTAVKPFPAHGLYCTGKAARDMLMGVVAAENPKVRALNYAPGPMDTAMQAEIHRSCKHEETRAFYAKMKADGNLVAPNDSAAVLARLLKEDTFESGAHLDYYDVRG